MALPLSTRLLKTVGIETKEYKKHLKTINDHLILQQHEARRTAFLQDDREKSLQQFPELAPVFEVQDRALSFYQDVLITTPYNVSTNRRNLLRAQAVASEALRYLDEHLPIPAYSREGRQQEATVIKSDELYNLRYELRTSFIENARINLAVKEESEARYALFSSLYFKNPQKAIATYPELASLEGLEKQARRYFKGTVRKDKEAQAIKDCLHRALLDIAQRIPIQQAIEIKADAELLKHSLIGIHTTPTNHATAQAYVYSVNLMQSLIGRNGLQTGFWGKDTTQITDRIESIDNTVQEMQARTAFFHLPKEEVLKNFPSLDVLYNKFEAACQFYEQKMATPFAKKAAQRLIEPDFKEVLAGHLLKAVNEVDASRHEGIIESIQHMQRLAEKNATLLTQNNSLARDADYLQTLQEHPLNQPDSSLFQPTNSSADLKAFVPEKTRQELEEEILSLKAQLESKIPSYQDTLMSIDDLVNELALESHDVSQSPQIEEDNSPSIQLSSLRSTAPTLPINHLFTNAHKSPIIGTEVAGEQWNIEAINAGLKANAEALACAILGEPLSRSSNQLRFGTNHGSLILTIKGEKEGLWYDHQTGQGGNLLTLIKEHQDGDFKKALEFAGDFLNLRPDVRTKNRIDLSDIASTLPQDKLKTIEYARELANQSLPIHGTLAETYLTTIRGIDIDLCSDNIRFLPEAREPESQKMHPALLIIGRGVEGAVDGIQLIYLDSEGNKLACKEPKRSYGMIKGSAIPVHVGGNLYGVSEGVETALSVAMACKEMTVFASLGSITNFSAMDLQGKNNTLVIFADNDKPGNPANEKTNRAAEELSKKGFNVLICKPREIGKDFNDVLREKGLTVLQQQVNQLKLYTPARAVANQVSQSRERLREKKFKSELTLGL